MIFLFICVVILFFYYKSTHISMVMQTNFVNPIFRFVISFLSHINKRWLA